MNAQLSPKSQPHSVHVDEVEASVGDRYGRAEDAAVQKAVSDLIAAHEEEFYDLVDAAQAEREPENEAARREAIRESLEDR